MLFHRGRQSIPQRPWHRNWFSDRDKAAPHSGQIQLAIADLSLSPDASGLSILKNGLSINIVLTSILVTFLVVEHDTSPARVVPSTRLFGEFRTRQVPVNGQESEFPTTYEDH